MIGQHAEKIKENGESCILKLHDPMQIAKLLSPNRKTTQANSIDDLVTEQLSHFNIDPSSEIGQNMADIAKNLYHTNIDTHKLWDLTLDSIKNLDRAQRVSFFNAKRFICFQLAKLLDVMQNPLRRSYQSVIKEKATRCNKGPYPIFDNVTAIFSATPVITRTATYLYACSEWIDDAFQGKEMMHEIYSRLMNPTSISLANHIVDLEAGPLAHEYFAWNFNSGMAAIDAILSHLVGYQDVILSSRNIYGGAYQLLKDWYGKQSNLNVAIEWFDGYTVDDFDKAYHIVKNKYADRLAKGRKIYVYMESPCNPHGYFLDVPKICKRAHQYDSTVICDSTVGTPILNPFLRKKDPIERPDFVLHSYTKDIVGTGTATAGVVIGRNERMFMPKHTSMTVKDYNGKDVTYEWDQTLFWNVYYIKGAFLDADKAFEVITGTRTLEMRILRKCINTMVLARILAAHPEINVKSSALEENENYSICQDNSYLGFPAPLFTFNIEGNGSGNSPIQRKTFKRFFDSLEPTFGLQVSLGLVNTVVLCPALTSHSEMSDEALKDAGITRTTVRVSVGDEDPRTLLAHFIKAAQNTLEQDSPGFSTKFPSLEEIDKLYQNTYIDVHTKYVNSQPLMKELLE